MGLKTTVSKRDFHDSFSSSVIEDYLWIVSLSLFTSALVLTFGTPKDLFISGAILTVIAAIFKASNDYNKRKYSNNYMGSIKDPKTGKTIGLIMKDYNSTNISR